MITPLEPPQPGAAQDNLRDALTVTPLVPPDPGALASAALDHLRAALTQLRALSEQPSADPIYARSAEQVAAIVAELEKHPAPPAADAR